MKKLLLLFLWMCLSCSTDKIENSSSAANLDFELVGYSYSASAQQVLETRLEVAMEAVTITNLTQSLGVPFSALRTFSKNDVITWYLNQDSNFTVWQKDIQTQETHTTTAPCDLNNENLQGVDNTANHLIYLTRYFGDIGETPESRIRIFDEISGCNYQALPNQSIRATYTYKNYLLVYSQNLNNSSDIHLTKINTHTGEIENEIQLNQEARITTGDHKLHVFMIDNTYHTYNLDSFDLVASKNFDYILVGNSEGKFFNTQFKDQLMVIDVPYAQPSLIPEGPAVVNLNNSELTTPYSILFNIQDALRETVPYQSATVGSYVTSLNKELIICSFNNSGGNPGIVISNFQGEIQKIVVLEQYLSEIIIIDSSS